METTIYERIKKTYEDSIKELGEVRKYILELQQENQRLKDENERLKSI